MRDKIIVFLFIGFVLGLCVVGPIAAFYVSVGHGTETSRPTTRNYGFTASTDTQELFFDYSTVGGKRAGRIPMKNYSGSWSKQQIFYVLGKPPYVSSTSVVIHSNDTNIPGALISRTANSQSAAGLIMANTHSTQSSSIGINFAFLKNGLFQQDGRLTFKYANRSSASGNYQRMSAVFALTTSNTIGERVAFSSNGVVQSNALMLAWRPSTGSTALQGANAPACGSAWRGMMRYSSAATGGSDATMICGSVLGTYMWKTMSLL